MSTLSPHTPPPAPADGQGAQALIHTLRVGFFGLRLVMLALVVIFLFSGMFIVQENQRAIVLRFGKVVTQADGVTPYLYSAGQWHFAWPRPIDEVVRISVGQARRVSTSDFWYRDSRNVLSNPGEKGAGQLVTGTDYYMLTGDDNILHTKWSMDYLINANSIDYYLTYADPEKQLIEVLDNVALKVVAHERIDDALYSRSEAVRTKVLENVKTEVARLGIGVTVTNVTFDAKQPPESTMAAFAQVLQAQQQASSRRNDALSYAAQRTNDAQGRASRLAAEAETYRQLVVSSVQADQHYFTQLQLSSQDSPETIFLTLYNNALANLVHKAKAVYILKPGQEIRVQLTPRKKSPNTPAKPGTPGR